mmetsp:Transcript_6623/g.5957  ORF Transcript_6623/g.5957 Transcript_6623/m.5957 type:complete len:88 (-) Transcript_6623:2120-2383(-)
MTGGSFNYQGSNQLGDSSGIRGMNRSSTITQLTDTQSIIDYIKDQIRQMGVDIEVVFSKFDTVHDGTLNIDEFTNGIKHFIQNVTPA